MAADKNSQLLFGKLKLVSFNYVGKDLDFILPTFLLGPKITRTKPNRKCSFLKVEGMRNKAIYFRAGNLRSSSELAALAPDDGKEEKMVVQD